EVSLHRLTLDPFRGLVAKELKNFDAKDRRRLLAVIDEVQLGVNYANLAHRKTFLDSLDLHDATLALPLGPKDPQGAKIEVAHPTGRLFFPPQQIYLAHAEADLFGIQVSASGRLINPQEFRPKSQGQQAAPPIVTQIIRELKALRYEAAPPVVSFTFSGDLA